MALMDKKLVVLLSVIWLPVAAFYNACSSRSPMEVQISIDEGKSARNSLGSQVFFVLLKKSLVVLELLNIEVSVTWMGNGVVASIVFGISEIHLLVVSTLTILAVLSSLDS